mmetsp:Transcript_47347/g.84698  ORF Transcript_47347/g.84698 Transcript_47347/m.84698 type:complete len:81 (-) Transcript_47347:57-299(-)
MRKCKQLKPHRSAQPPAQQNQPPLQHPTPEDTCVRDTFVHTPHHEERSVILLRPQSLGTLLHLHAAQSWAWGGTSCSGGA